MGTCRFRLRSIIAVRLVGEYCDTKHANKLVSRLLHTTKLSKEKLYKKKPNDIPKWCANCLASRAALSLKHYTTLARAVYLLDHPTDDNC